MSNPLPPSNSSGEPPTRVSYAPPARPGSVTAGCLMSWIGAAFGGLLGIALIAAAGDKTFQDQAGVSSSDGAASLRLVGILMILWCILVAALAVKAFRRKRWGAIGLAVMGTAFALFTLFNMVASGNATGRWR